MRDLMRHPKLLPASLLSAAMGLLVAWTAPTASAAGLNPIAFQPSSIDGDILSVATSRQKLPRTLSVALDFHFTDSPLGFVATDLEGRGQVLEETIENRAMGELLMSFSPWSFLDIGVAIPLVLMGEGGTTSVSFQGGETVPGQSITGVGDISGFHVGEVRGALRGNLYRGRSWGVAVQADGTFPTAQEEALAGNGLGYGGRLVMDVALGPVLLAMNAGVYMRDEPSQVGYLEVGNEAVLGLGGEIEVNEHFTLVGEAYARTPMDDPFADTSLTQMEGMAGLRWQAAESIAVTVGGGGGTPLFLGYGTSRFRAFADVRFGGQLFQDTDGDGISDGDDACPYLPEDVDGYDDLDGCPDPDNDGDGFLDPNDECPDEAEDRDDFEDDDGCPEADNDQDGVPDVADQCVLDPEDMDQFQDDDGCPDLDNDEDGIPDAIDKCPLEPETYNEFEDDDGCKDFPGVGEAGVRFTMAKPVRFHMVTRELLSGSYQILRDLARYLESNPTYRVRAELHCAITGRLSISDAAAKRRMEELEGVTKTRGKFLKRFLVTEGVSPARILIQPIGAARPLEANDTETGRKANDRVEFYIIRE